MRHFQRFRKWLSLILAPIVVLVAMLAGSVGTALAYSTASGYAASDFATGFPWFAYSWGNAGPIGLAFDSSDNLYVSDIANGYIYKFGPAGGVAGAATLVNSTPIFGDAVVFDKSGHLYQGDAQAHTILEISPSNGSVIRTAATLPVPPGGIATDPLSGDLFVSTATSPPGGIYRISNFASGPGTVTTYTPPSAINTDGIAFAPDGTLYAAADGRVVKIAGTNQANAGAVTTLASIPGADGVAVAANPSNPSQPPFLFLNRNDGIITKLDLTVSPPTQTNIFTGGTRGDFSAVGPDGCLYATQSDRVVKVTNADGTCSLAPTSAVPQISLTSSNPPATPISTGTGVTLTATFDNTTAPSGTPVDWTVTGANPQTTTTTTNGAGTATLTYTGAHAGTDTITASTTISGTDLISNPQHVTWQNSPPTVSAGSSYSGDEGAAITLSGASASDADGDSLTYSWHYAPVSAPSGASCAFDHADALNPNLTCNDNGSYKVTLSVDDGHGHTVTSDAPVTVGNVAPTITSFAPDRTSALTGQQVTFTGAATDPSSNDMAAGLTWAFATDGGAFGAFGASNKLITSFSTCGSHTASATARDKDGGTSDAASTNLSTYDAAWQAPLSPDKVNVAKGGSVIPVKITVGCNGTPLTGLSPTIQVIQGTVDGTTDTGLNEVDPALASAPDTSGVMRYAAPQYIYNVRVPAAASGTVYTIRVRPFGDTDPKDSLYVTLQVK